MREREAREREKRERGERRERRERGFFNKGNVLVKRLRETANPIMASPVWRNWEV